MTDHAAEPATTEKNVPVKDWIPHTKSDSSDYLDTPGVAYDDLTPEQKAEYDAQQKKE